MTRIVKASDLITSMHGDDDGPAVDPYEALVGEFDGKVRRLVSAYRKRGLDVSDVCGCLTLLELALVSEGAAE